MFASAEIGYLAFVYNEERNVRNNHCSGVFSTGATGATATVILRKRLIAPVILPGMYPKGRNFEDDLNK